MPSLPQRLPLSQMQTQWSSLINPVLANPLTQSQILTGVKLISGTTQVNHKLGRALQGWMICGINGVSSVYDTQASNQMPDLTLTLVSSAAVTVNLVVF